MTFAIIKTGGKQYLVKEGDLLTVEKLPTEKGGKVSFDQVLLVGDDQGETLKIGQPTVAGAKVEAEILDQTKAKKVHVIKFKSKVRYHRHIGHRQQVTKVKITKIG